MKLFGTDGIRARYGEAPLDPVTLTAIGRAIRGLLDERGVESHILMAGDTRESTNELARHLLGGLGDGVRVDWGGVLPTPAVAILTRGSDATLGIAISASHNPFHDNGIKFFDHDGFKFDDDQEANLEARIRRALDEGPTEAARTAPPLPAVDPALQDAYLDSLVAAAARDGGPDETGSEVEKPGDEDPSANRALSGLRVVLDTGHGAAYRVAPRAFERLGAEVHVLCDTPDGRNINDACGSTAPEKAAARVPAVGAHIGFAFDGDADRVIVVDDEGSVRDGDELLVVLARAAQQAGGLEPPEIVATSMSNLGLERALGADGISVARCDVGDRAVVAMLRERGLRLGGEQSGHLVDLAHSTTGDGVRTALEIARMVQRSGQPFGALAQGFARYPQTLVNVPVREKPPFEQVPAVQDALAAAEHELEGRGRVVLRYSGTEPLARVMVEADDEDLVARTAARLAGVLAAELG